MPRGMKRVIDVERQVDEISEPTDNELRAMTAETMARVAALRRRWEAAGDMHALIGALIFFQSRLPEWLFKGLMRTLKEQFKNPHVMRFLAVRHAHDVLRMSMDESYNWASKHITDPPAKGGTGATPVRCCRAHVAVPRRDQDDPAGRRRCAGNDDVECMAAL
jgi:hypothetical protein